MRNLLFIHLESLNYMIYQTNKRLFPTLRKWEKKSLSFLNYFSTATSTLMVISDLAYGGMLQNEPCESLTSGLQKYYYKTSMLDDLQNRGYRVKAVDYPANEGKDVERCNERHFIGYGMEMEEMKSYKLYLNALEDTMSGEMPFAVWACNYISNVNYYHYMENVESQTGMERWESGYAYMDRCVKDLLDILEKKNLLENTTIIFYGDHGDDMLAHGRHRGLMHAIEPYASLIHTPFWIYDSRFVAEEINSLIDTTDVRSIVEKLLGLPEKVDKKLRLSNLKLFARKYSFARSAYAAQRVRESSFHKGYSITDGRFLFLAGNQGMELYHMDMDAACQHNLLDYFDFQENTLSLNKTSYNRIKFHFSEVFDRGALQQIEKLFYAFRERLMQEVDDIYQYAECQNRNLEIDFENIHYGWEEKERRINLEIAGQNIIAEMINQLLNCMQINRLAIYGDVENELQGVYRTVEQCRISRREEICLYEVLYISLKDLKELSEIKTWIDLYRDKLTILIHIKEENGITEEADKLLDIIYKYHNPSLINGTFYFAGRIFEYPDSIVIPEQFKVLAIIHFYNEADILDRTIEYLISQEVDIYLVDNWSDDGSYEIAQRYREKYQERIFLERFPSAGSNTYYDWYHQLERTEDIAIQMNYDWYIHYDVDEMRLGPWRNRNLRETIYYIDMLGFNAIDNTVIDFKLTSNDGSNIFMRDTYFDFRHSRAGFRQRKTWKKTVGIELKKSGGHIAKIENPKPFPLKILNRHYPLRSIEQAYQKIFIDRKPRFGKENKERGWHGHYNHIVNRKDLLTDKKNLVLWDDSAWDKYYISLFMGCGIQIDDKEEFDIYRNYLEGKKVVIYGAGNYGKYFCEKMEACVDIVAWIDKDYVYLPCICCRKIQPVADINCLEFDAVFIAIVNNKTKQEVKEMLVQMGISVDKIY